MFFPHSYARLVGYIQETSSGRNWGKFIYFALGFKKFARYGDFLFYA